MALWVSLLIIIAIGAVLPLAVLLRQRRLFLRDPQRRRFFLDYVNRTDTTGPFDSRGTTSAGPPSDGPAVPAWPVPPAKLTSPAARLPDAAVVYVDASGECTFANQAARDLLHWTTGNLSLRDVLAGGRSESDALMASLARRGLVEQHPTTLAGPTHAPLEISAVAVRDRDDNLWGAAVFIRRAAAAPAPTPFSRRAWSPH